MATIAVAPVAVIPPPPKIIDVNFKVITSDKFVQLPAFSQTPCPSCSICLTNFIENANLKEGMPLVYHECAVSEDSKEPVIIKPIHAFHFTCLAEWFDSKHNCPECKGEVKLEEFFRNIRQQFPVDAPVIIPNALREYNGPSAPVRQFRAVDLTTSEIFENVRAEVTKAVKEIFYYIGQFALIVVAALVFGAITGPIGALVVVVVGTKSLGEELRQKHNA